MFKACRQTHFKDTYGPCKSKYGGTQCLVFNSLWNVISCCGAEKDENNQQFSDDTSGTDIDDIVVDDGVGCEK